MGVSPWSFLRFLRFLFELLQPRILRHIFAEPPAPPLLDQPLIHVHAIMEHGAKRSAMLILAMCLHFHIFSKDERGGRLFAFCPKGCPFSGQSIPYNRIRSVCC